MGCPKDAVDDGAAERFESEIVVEMTECDTERAAFF